jgi:3,4-dihydroxy 2-butanone 4-phosphate synthase/GTP cyclohydrolase II
LICTPLVEERCDNLGLEMMVDSNNSHFDTPFTVSIDLIGDGCSTGISAADRSKTVQALIDPNTKPKDLGKPGHIFPLRAKAGGVLRRAGHTEAAVDLSRLAGFEPAGLIVEIMNEDGTMARLPELKEIAKRFNLKIVTIEALIAYRMQHETLIEEVVEVDLPTKYGDFKLKAFKQTTTGEEHLALVKGKWDKNESVLVRVHSSCFTGDILGSLRCDCGDQLTSAMSMINRAGKGVVLYVNQEGRGIGLLNKLKAYKLQEQGYDTLDANLKLGFKGDARDYGVGAQILRAVGVQKMKLLTNNPKKRTGLTGYGLEITETVDIEIECNIHNEKYLETKKEKMGHDLKIKKTR